MTNKISQREARLLRKRVKELEIQRRLLMSRWISDIPIGAVHIDSINLYEVDYAKLNTAAALGFVVLAKSFNQNRVEFYAVRP